MRANRASAGHREQGAWEQKFPQSLGGQVDRETLTGGGTEAFGGAQRFPGEDPGPAE